MYRSRVYEGATVDALPSHDAPLTSLEFHPIQRGSSLYTPPQSSPVSTLYLTSSYDWTIKLWSATYQKPICIFENARDYVYDCRWLPSNPAVFVSGDGMGKVDVWNLRQQTEVPVYSLQVRDHHQPTHSGVVAAPQSPANHDLSNDGLIDGVTSSSSLRPSSAISRLRFNESGDHLAIGTSDGTVCVYEVDQSLYQTSVEEVREFYEKIGKKAQDAQTE